MRKKIKKIKKDLHYIFFIRAFSLVETLMVLAIMGILYSITLPLIQKAKERAYYSRVKQEFQTVSTALELYKADNNGNYPADADRNLPNGLEKYIAGYEGGTWPKAPWPGSVYDWDNWAPEDLDYPPNTIGVDQVYQISVRFCEMGKPETCKFPNEKWAEEFDENSAAYYCIQGPCRSHRTLPVSHKGYCINCEDEN